MEEWSKKVNIKFQQLLDKSAPFKLYRWLGLGALVALYAVRVFSIKGFYIITYALAIYNLNLLLGFISPSTDPELDGPVLPSRSDDEYRPFVRRLQEMKFWMMSSRAFLIGLTATLFPFLDIPVFWPILLMYWLVLVGITMRRQIKHMIKYKYLPFDFGKQVQPLIAGERTGSSSDPLSHTMASPQRRLWCRKGRTVRPRFEEIEL